MDASLLSSLNTGMIHAAVLMGKSQKRNTITCKASQPSLGDETSYYKVLALDSENVGIGEIKRAYRSMVLRHHPDVCPPSKREESTQIFMEIQRAYKTLSNPNLRQKYDQQLGLIEVGDPEEFKGRGSIMFPKAAWMDQLNELEARSAERMRKKKKKKMGCC